MNYLQHPNISAPFSGQLDSVTHARASKIGKVFLVGAGPGDAELLTVKALRIIQSADIIFYDYLVSAEIRALFPKNTPAIYVGKAKNQHSIAQDDLNQLLVQQALAGLTVCRIKGGDPFVFGRGGEELLELRSAGIESEVVPGITSASGCSTYADIPLTHRSVSQGCTFCYGSRRKNFGCELVCTRTIKSYTGFYMGLTRAADITHDLLKAGMSAETPVAIIENGCRKNQRNIITELQDLPDAVLRDQVQSPALIIVGEVVRLKKGIELVVEQQQMSLSA